MTRQGLEMRVCEGESCGQEGAWGLHTMCVQGGRDKEAAGGGQQERRGARGMQTEKP